MKLTVPAAVKAVEKHGALLVYPLQNSSEPASLWSAFFPKSQMRWEWDAGADNRVAGIWHLRAELMASKKVVYAKWFRGRATFFSKDVFTKLLAELWFSAPHGLSHDAKNLLEILETNSPLSTKALKKASDLRGRDLEPTYQKAMKSLWEKLLIVGVGEVDDGAFPSLAVGATELLHEELWRRAQEIKPPGPGIFPEGTAFRKFLERLKTARSSRSFSGEKVFRL